MTEFVELLHTSTQSHPWGLVWLVVPHRASDPGLLCLWRFGAACRVCVHGVVVCRPHSDPTVLHVYLAYLFVWGRQKQSTTQGVEVAQLCHLADDCSFDYFVVGVLFLLCGQNVLFHFVIRSDFSSLFFFFFFFFFLSSDFYKKNSFSRYWLCVKYGGNMIGRIFKSLPMYNFYDFCITVLVTWIGWCVYIYIIVWATHCSRDSLVPQCWCRLMYQYHRVAG